MIQGFASLLELNGLLRAGKIRARDLLRQAARDLQAESGPGGAVRLLFLDEAMDAARGVERDLSRGRTRGILQGAPFGVSELLQTAGRAPSWDPRQDPRSVEEAAAVRRLRSARAIPLAVVAEEDLGGVAQGLRASGDAAASLVARGLLPFAVSLDFNGNVLRAAWKRGCWAFRPTFGTVSAFGAAPLGWTLPAVSVVARTPEDCGHVLGAMSGSDSRCAHSPGRTFHFAPQYARHPRELRVADAAVGAAVRSVVERCGATVTAAPQLQGPAVEILEVVLAAEAGEVLEDVLDGTAQGQQFLEQARQLRAFEYLRAMRLRRALQQWFYSSLEDVDAVMFGAAPAAGEAPEEGEGAAGLAWLATALLAGAPVIAFGGGGGLPGFCLTGRAGSENTILRLADALAGIVGPSDKSG